MHADEINDVVLDALESGEKDFILLNFANSDLVGHTGNLEAAVKAVEAVDRNIGRLMDKVEDTDYVMLVTSDHGNCEDMGVDEPNTSHTLNPVPLVGKNVELDSDNQELWEVEQVIENILDL